MIKVLRRTLSGNIFYNSKIYHRVVPHFGIKLKTFSILHEFC